MQNKTFIKPLKKVQRRLQDEGISNTNINDVCIFIDLETDLSQEESYNKSLELVRAGYIETKDDSLEEDSKIIDVRLENYKEDIGYTEPFEVSSDELDKIEIAREFAEWLVRGRKDIKTVKLDSSRNSKQIWHYDENVKIWKKGGEDRVAELLYQEIPNEHSQYLENEVKTKVYRIDPIHIDQTGTQKGELPVKNGLLKLKKDKLKEIKRKDYLTSKIPVKYDPKASEPKKFLKFLKEVTINQEDIEKIQEYLGYCLMTGTAKYEKALIILGPTDSGKTVFLDVVRELLGPTNIAQQSLQDLTNGRKWSLANLVGKIANIDHDLDPEAIEDIGTVKKITSGNPITVEPKWEQPYDYTPTAKHLFSANRTPARDKEDEAFYNRWLTVVFPKTIPEGEQNSSLTEDLTEESELEKILNWSVEGYHRLEEQGQFTGENGPYATKEIWKEWGNSIERFISKFMVTRRQKVRQAKKKDEYDKSDIQDIECEIHTSTAYEVYQKYATGIDMDMEVKSMKAFSSEIKKLKGVESKKLRISGNQRRGFKGITLAEDANKRVEKLLEDRTKW